MKEFLFCLLVLTLSSCDYENIIEYKVANRTADSLHVSFSFKNNHFDTEASDTSFVLPPAHDKIIFESIVWGGSVYNPEGSRMSFFRNMKIHKINSQSQLAIDVYKTSNWTYREKSAHSAEYRLTLDDEDFE